jgi:hypothetical protein
MIQGVYYHDTQNELLVFGQLALILDGQTGGTEDPHNVNLAYVWLIAELMRSGYCV